MAAAVLFVVLAAGVYAYFTSLQPQAGPRASITSPPLEFSIELDKTEYGYAENVTIGFALKNTGNQTIEVTYCEMQGALYHPISTEVDDVYTRPGDEHLLSVLFHFDFSITDNNGTRVFQWSQTYFSNPATYAIYLEPNGCIKQTLVQCYYFDWATKPLPKGTYHIRGVLHIGVQPGPMGGVTLETPSITFTVK